MRSQYREQILNTDDSDRANLYAIAIKERVGKLKTK